MGVTCSSYLCGLKDDKNSNFNDLTNKIYKKPSTESHNTDIDITLFLKNKKNNRMVLFTDWFLNKIVRKHTISDEETHLKICSLNYEDFLTDDLYRAIHILEIKNISNKIFLKILSNYPRAVQLYNFIQKTIGTSSSYIQLMNLLKNQSHSLSSMVFYILFYYYNQASAFDKLKSLQLTYQMIKINDKNECNKLNIFIECIYEEIRLYETKLIVEDNLGLSRNTLYSLSLKETLTYILFNSSSNTPIEEKFKLIIDLIRQFEFSTNQFWWIILSFIQKTQKTVNNVDNQEEYDYENIFNFLYSYIVQSKEPPSIGYIPFLECFLTIGKIKKANELYNFIQKHSLDITEKEKLASIINNLNK